MFYDKLNNFEEEYKDGVTPLAYVTLNLGR